VWMLTRIVRLEWQFRGELNGRQSTDGLARGVGVILAAGVDSRLLSGRQGLQTIEVRFREPQDTTRHLAELLDAIVTAVAVTKFADVNRLIKMLYQWQHTLDLSPSQLTDCLRILQGRLMADNFMGQPIGRVEIVTPGILMDGKTMMALTPGTHVKQPLGVVAFDREGKVLAKAKVLCG